MRAGDVRRYGPWVVIVSLLLAYGLEIFPGSISFDEPVLAQMGRWGMLKFWVGAGRWAMGLINITIPTPVVPVVTTGLGVGMMGLGMWCLASSLKIRGWMKPLAVATASTFPMLAWFVVFNTNVLGIGVAFLLLALAAHLILLDGRLRMVAATVACAWVAGTYDSLIVAVAVLPALVAVARPERRSWVRGAAVTVGGVLLSFIVRTFARVVLAIPDSHYVDGYFNVTGLFHSPLHTMTSAATAVVRALSLPVDTYGRSSPWLLVTCSLAAAVAVFAIAGAPDRISRAAGWLCLAGAPVAAAAAVHEVPVQAMLYLPICFLGMVALATNREEVPGVDPSDATGAGQGHLPLAATRRQPVLVAVMILAALTIASNAVLCANVQAAARTTYERDQEIAWRINDELLRAFPEATMADPVPVVVSSPFAHEAGPWQPEFASLYMGARWTGPNFLQLKGIPAADPTHEQWVTGIEATRSMPRYPAAGWARVVNGVLVCHLGAVPPQFVDGGPHSGN